MIFLILPVTFFSTHPSFDLPPFYNQGTAVPDRAVASDEHRRPPNNRIFLFLNL